MAKDKTAVEWVEVYNHGLEYRRVFGLEQTWTDIEAKFFSVSADCDTGPNILASKGDTIISALSVPDVGVMVTGMNERSATTAPIVQALDNETLEGIDANPEAEQALTYAFLWGHGFLKVGYDSEYGYDKDKELPGVGGSLTQYNEKGDLIESGRARSGEVWVKPVMPHDVVVPWGTRTLEDAPAIFHRVVRSIDEVKADKKYDKAKTSKLQPQLSMRDITLGYSIVKERAEETREASQDSALGPDSKVYIELIEVMDRLTKRVIVIALGQEPVIIRDVENTLQVDNQLPWVDVCLGLRTRSFWITPPAYYAVPHQIELDDIHVQAKEQRRASVLKILAQKGAFSPEAKEDLLNGKVGMLVEVEDMADLDKAVKYIGGNVNINLLLHQEEDSIESNAREALGISKNIAGEYGDHSRISATETSVVQQGGEMRLGRKQKALRFAYKRLVQLINGILATHWQVPQAVRVIGPDGGERWEEVSAEILRSGRFSYAINFSAEHYATPARRQQMALQLYSSLAGDSRFDSDALLEEVVAAFGTPGLRKVKMKPGMPQGPTTPAAVGKPLGGAPSMEGGLNGPV